MAKTNNTNNKEHNKKKKIDSDLVTVIFIITLIIVVAVLFALFNYKGDSIKHTGTKAQIEQEQKENNEKIVITVGVSAAAIFAITAMYKIRNKKKKRKAIEEKLRKQKELEEAMSRIRSKRENSILAKNNTSVLSDRSKYKKDKYDEVDDDDIVYGSRGIRHKYDFNNIEDDYLDDEPGNNSLARRNFNDIDFDSDEVEQYIRNYNRGVEKPNKKPLYIGIGVAAVAIVATVAMVLAFII